MPLEPGVQLGVYEIVALIGAGGMGEVYRAIDTRLKRHVAVKILPPSLATDSQRLSRFQREAELLAALNHPGIAGIYGLEDSGGTTALVMELIEGEDLSQRIARGPVPIDEALPIAKQIADALEAAHSHGIIHRDLKPANIKVRPDGMVKVLDFGLAKALAPEQGGTAGVTNPSHSPTITSPALLSNVGIVLGTAAYMAPEQAKGLEADKRSDVWAFGCVLFEMLTARRPFDGEDMTEVLGAVVRLEPPWDALPSEVPAPVRTLLQQCLVKDRRRRVGDIAAAQFVLDHQAGLATGAVATSRSARVAWIVAAMSVAALSGTLVWLAAGRSQRPDSNLVRFTIPPPANTSFGGPPSGGTGNIPQVAVSPDGRNIVYVAGPPVGFHLWLRPVGSAEAHQIPGTEGAAFPFWSPDSQFIAFFAGNKLKKVAIAGGRAIEVADAPQGLGGSWNRDNVILFGTSRSGVSRVSAGGGAPAAVTTLAQGEDAHRWPHFLPDGQHFLFNAVTGTCCPPASPGSIKVASLDRAEPVTTLLEADSTATFASGHLLFARDEVMMAQAFDPRTRQLTGDAVPVLESVSREGSRYASASVSQNGTLVYAAGGAPNPQQLTWFNRAGATLGSLGVGSGDSNLAISPDEKQVALAVRTGSPLNLDIWTIDVARNMRSRLTTDPEPQGFPVWLPGGTGIVFGIGGRAQVGQPRLVRIPVNATGSSETLLLAAADTPARPCGPEQCMLIPTDVSVDGRYLLYTFTGSFPLTSDIWALPLFGERKPFPVLATPFRESLGTFSPNGQWIAYMTDEIGEPNVYVQSFPGPGGKYRISQSGGRNPHWRADGKELFYLDGTGAMTSVSIDTSRGFYAGLPKILFQTGVISLQQMYAVTKDGQRFLVNAREGHAAAMAPPLTVVLNWASTLQKQ